MARGGRVNAALAATLAQRIVPIVRTADRDSAQAQCEILVESGFRVIELTLTTPGALEIIRSFVREPALFVGAGSIVSEAQIAPAIDAGASFLVSPVAPEWLVPRAHDAGVAVMPGAATPSEAYAAQASGADLVKLFPIARLGGAPFIRDVLAPMPTLPLMATGGVTASEALTLLDAGCLAVGLGSILTDSTLGGNPAERARHALALVAA